MEYDPARIEQAMLALLGAFEFEHGRVWKRYDFDVMAALHARGLITNPRGHRESVYLTEDGLRLAKEMAARHFAADSARSSQSQMTFDCDQSIPRPRRLRRRRSCDGSHTAASHDATAAL